MLSSDVPHLWQVPAAHGVDDAYTAWSNAHRRCTAALRAWEQAATDDRAAAYQVYVATLDLEEIAAAELARLHILRAVA